MKNETGHRGIDRGLSKLGEGKEVYNYKIRYYAPPTFISRDPLFEKYPFMSPYAYCNNNPVIYIDPTGMEVEHETFKDKVNTFFARVFNSTFREQYKTLKKSDETYVFKNNKTGDNSFSTDGKKLYINYSKTEKTKAAGANIFSLLRHETEHGIQFEHGEIGFILGGEGSLGGDGTFYPHQWLVTNYDVGDELKAHDAGAMGTTMHGTEMGDWLHDREGNPVSEAVRRIKIQDKTAYKNLSPSPKNNTNTEKIKDFFQYALPYKPR
jgi:RHS repeat-associated protein